MKWPWIPRKVNGHSECIRIHPGALNWTPDQDHATERIERMEEAKREFPQPNFTASLITSIELLKRGAVVVDMHEFNMRIRKAGDTWGICSIPAHARAMHAQLELNDQLSYEQEETEPIDGQEATDGDAGTTAGVGATPPDA